MFGFHWLAPRLGAAAIVLTALIAPLAGSAQDLPPYAAPGPSYGAPVPSYARPAQVDPDETIHGRIRSVDGAFNISVDDDRGFVDSVQLHQGTIINPTGLTLSPGMSVTILGVNTGSTFSANEIDTPYTYAGPLPTPVYYGPGYWCPGFAYGYGPSFSLAIVIGDDDRPWYFEHRRFYGRPWDGHGYFGAYVGQGPDNRGLVGAPRSATNPARHPGTGARTNVHPSDAHVPAAFAGRSFAGEPRVAGDHFSAVSNSSAPASARSIPADRRNAYSQEVESRGYPGGAAPSRAYPSGAGPAQAYPGGAAPMRGPSGGSGSGRSSAGGPGGGSAHGAAASHGGGGGGGGHAH